MAHIDIYDIPMISEYYIDQSRRITERKQYQEDIFFSRGVMVFHGKCKNISTAGALIINSSLFTIEAGNEIFIAIPFPKGQSRIKRRAIVRWIEDDRIGVQFFKRKKSRKIYQRRVTVFTESMILPAMIDNLSRGGAHIVGRKNSRVSKESEIHVIIPFANRNEEIMVRAVVKWIRDGQFGIQFI